MTPRKKTSPKSPSRPVRPGKYDPTRKPKGPGGTDSRRPMGARRRTVATPPSELPGERLQKVLASAGIASRREAEQIILEGRVEVDGVVVTELGTRVDRFQQAIFIDGLRLPSPKRVYYAVNKPVGVVCTARDPAGRPRIADLLPPDTGRVFNVGRLDMSSDGLILVTNDGDLANRLTHPRHGEIGRAHV